MLYVLDPDDQNCGEPGVGVAISSCIAIYRFQWYSISSVSPDILALYTQ